MCPIECTRHGEAIAASVTVTQEECEGVTKVLSSYVLYIYYLFIKKISQNYNGMDEESLNISKSCIRQIYILCSTKMY